MKDCHNRANFSCILMHSMSTIFSCHKSKTTLNQSNCTKQFAYTAGQHGSHTLSLDKSMQPGRYPVTVISFWTDCTASMRWVKWQCHVCINWLLTTLDEVILIFLNELLNKILYSRTQAPSFHLSFHTTSYVLLQHLFLPAMKVCFHFFHWKHEAFQYYYMHHYIWSVPSMSKINAVWKL